MKAIYNNTENGLIAYKGDHRPIQICRGGQLIDNISAVPQATEGNPVTYSSEYKANLIELTIEGNTKQHEGASPTTPQIIKISGNYEIITDYTSEVMTLLKSGSASSGGVTGVAIVGLPSEMVDKTITYSLSASMPSGYSIGLLKGTNFLLGESVAITTLPTIKSGFDNIYINGITSFDEILSLFESVIVNAIEETDTGDSGIDVELRGVNLLNSSKFLSKQNVVTTHIENGFVAEKGTLSITSIVYFLPIEIEEGIAYRGSLDCSFLNSVTTRPNEIHVRLSANNSLSSITTDYLTTVISLGTSEETKRRSLSFTTPTGQGYKYAKIVFYANVTGTTLPNDYKATLTNITLTKDEHLPYEPYFDPVTVNIPSEVTLTDGTVVPLLMGEGDKIVVNKSENKVLYIEKGWQEDISTRTFVDRTAESTFNDGRMWFQPNASNIPLSVVGKGYCNILAPTDNTHGDYNHFKVGQYQGAMTLGIITTGFNSLDQFNTWKETNPIIVRLERVTPIEYDLTNTDLGQQLLALAEATQNQTNIITATSNLPISKQVITYAKWGGVNAN